MSTRLDRVNALIETEVSTALAKELDTPAVLATVTSVTTSRDLRQATVRVSTVPDSDDVWPLVTETLTGLQAHVAARLRMKRTPKLHLKHDLGAQHASRIDRLLREASNAE